MILSGVDLAAMSFEVEQHVMSTWLQRKLLSLEKDIMFVIAQHLPNGNSTMPLLNNLISRCLRNFPDLAKAYLFKTEEDRAQELTDEYSSLFKK